MILQAFIFIVKTIFASGPICREIEKQKVKKEVEKWLAQGKMSKAKIGSEIQCISKMII